MFLKKTDAYGKIKRKIRTRFLDFIKDTPFQFKLYTSYWHYRLQKPFTKRRALSGSGLYYMAQKPNYSAGIGHQLANWNAGYYFSGRFKLSFAHFPFSNKTWEHLLGLGENETDANTLLKNGGFKKIRLPRFNSENDEEVTLIGNIIRSYQSGNVFFLLEQDQGYMEQCGTAGAISKKFLIAAARAENKLIYNPARLNIAVHIRRGDIVSMKQANEANWKDRWLNNDYYVQVLKNIFSAVGDNGKADVYLFSQGSAKDFSEFASFPGIHYCLDMNAYDSFVHMVYADILISSKSSFSYKPALISQGIKICPGGFWHAYPVSVDFIVADDKGNFDKQQLVSAFKNKKEEMARQ